MIIALMIAIYFIGSGATFVVMGNKICPDNYWNEPGPFFSGLAWPIVLPMLMGGAVGKVFIGEGNGSRTDRRRAKEIAEAEHNKHLAEIRAETTAALERALD